MYLTVLAKALERESVQAGHPQSSIQLILFYDISPHPLLELHQVDFCLIGQLVESLINESLSTCTDVAVLECLLVSSWLIADIFEKVALFVSDFNLQKKMMLIELL